MTEAFKDRPTTVADYLAIFRRRAWIVLFPPLAAGITALFLSSSQSPLYRANAEILVNLKSLVTSITNVTDPSAGDPNRFLRTQASVARSPELAARVAAALPGLTPRDVLAQTSITPSSDSDLLTISAESRSAPFAVRLANVFAEKFTTFTKERATEGIDEALASLQVRIKSLAAHGQVDSPLYVTLIQQQGQLATVGKLLAGNTSVLQPAAAASKVRPRPKRDAILAGLLGLVLGLALAFLAEALDRRVRSEHELEEALPLPLLSRVPKPPRRLQKANELVMLKDPGSVQAETFRKLRTSLEFVNADGAARTIMVTSAVAQEGKSTTIANLAVALARANRRVVLVDLDLRAPFLSRLFHVRARPGITDVAVKRATLAQAIQPIALPQPRAPKEASSNGGGPSVGSNGVASVEGLLHLLPAGTIPPSADEMLQDARLLGILDELATKFEIVLVDAPPLVAFGDAMSLSAHVDAIFAITRLGRVPRPILHEFARQLQACRANLLGYVITGVEHSDSYRYMYEGYLYESRAREKASSKERV